MPNRIVSINRSAPLTQEEKDIIISCGGEFYKTNNDPYQVLANRLDVDRNVAKQKYYQYLYTEVECFAARSVITDGMILMEVLNIVGAHGLVRTQILEEARERADVRYQRQVDSRRRRRVAL